MGEKVSSFEWSDTDELARRVAHMMNLMASELEVVVAPTAIRAGEGLKDNDPLKAEARLATIAAQIAAKMIRDRARQIVSRGLPGARRFRASLEKLRP